MKRFFSLFFLLLLISMSCREDDDLPGLSICPGESDYALDFQSISSQERRIWLTEADRDVAFDRSLDPTVASSVQFLNFPNACENVYTVSVASFPQGGPNLDASQIRRNLRIREVTAMPSGSLLDRSSSIIVLRSIWGERIIVKHCPPVEQVQFLATAQQLDGGFRDLVESYTYEPTDSTLSLVVENLILLDSDALLSIKTTDGQWVGIPQDFQGTPITELDYSAFAPLAPQTLAINWPAGASDARAELRQIISTPDQKSVILDQKEGEASLDALVPLSGVGPFVLHLHWNDEQEHELQQVFETLPEEVDAVATIEGEFQSFNYVELRYAATGADIITIEGNFRGATNEYCERHYTGPAGLGDQRILFGPLSPRLEELSADLGDVYRQAFTDDRELSLYRYPGMNGSYQWYLRNVLSSRGTNDTWLQSLEYERLILPF